MGEIKIIIKKAADPNNVASIPHPAAQPYVGTSLLMVAKMGAEAKKPNPSKKELEECSIVDCKEGEHVRTVQQQQQQQR